MVAVRLLLVGEADEVAPKVVEVDPPGLPITVLLDRTAVQAQWTKTYGRS